jgi:hypothetical protein
MLITRPKLSFRTKQTVNADLVTAPLVGFESISDPPEGWLFDIKRWSSLFDLRLPTLPRLVDLEPQGVSASKYFLSGVGNKDLGDLEVLKIKEMFTQDGRSWIPIINTGYYYNYNSQFFCFSDHSVVQYLSASDNTDDRNVLLLDSVPSIEAPIIAASYKRNPITWKIEYDQKINRVSSFSGIYVDGVEQETVNSSYNISWANVDFLKKNSSLISALKTNTDYVLIEIS